MSWNATCADCEVLDVVDEESAVVSEASLLLLFAALEDRVALDKMPPFFGLPAAAEAAAAAGTEQ